MPGVAGDAGSNPAVSSGLSLTQLKKAREIVAEFEVFHNGTTEDGACVYVRISESIDVKINVIGRTLREALLIAARGYVRECGLDVSKLMFSLKIDGRDYFAISAIHFSRADARAIVLVSNVKPDNGTCYIPDGKRVAQIMNDVSWIGADFSKREGGFVNEDKLIFDLLMAGF